MSGFGKKELLGKICHKITDGTHKTPAYQDSGIVFLSAKNIKNGTLSLAVHKYISEEEHLELTKRCKPEAGDVMLSKSGSLGDAITVPNLPFSFSIFESLALIKPKRDILSAEYLQQYLNSPLSKRYFWSITSGIGVKHLHLVDLRKMPIHVPSLGVQAQITGVLDIWDNAIEKTEALIAAKEKQFEWLCTNLLSGRKKSFGFTGKSIPTAFGSIFSLFKKVNTSCADYEALSVTKDGIVSQSEYFNKEVASKDKSKYLIVDKDTLVMSGLNFWMGAIDFQTIRDTGIVSPAYKTFKVNEGPYNRDYLRFFIRSHYMTKILLDSSIQGASIVRRNLDMEWLSNSLIDLPNLEEQIDIANILSLAEKEIDGLKLLAEKYRSQKRGLMQKLLTGEWQVGSSQLLSEETCQEFSREGVA